MKKLKLLTCPKTERSRHGLRKKKNISEPNRKLGNLGNMSLPSNSDSSYKSRNKNDTNMN